MPAVEIECRPLVAIGSFKRVPPALATTLGAFAAIRIPIAVYLPPHYLTALTAANASAGSWVVSTGIAGHTGTGHGGSISIADVPASCQATAAGSKGGPLPCLTGHGFHQVATHRPAGRFWAFQGIEAGIFVVLPAAFVALAYRVVLRRDA